VSSFLAAHQHKKIKDSESVVHGFLSNAGNLRYAA